MSLKDKLMEDLKTSMKNKDKLRKDTITMVRAAIKQKEVDERVELTDEQVLEILTKQVKEKKSSIEEFQKGNRQDLIDQANSEIEILLDYLPEQLTEEELTEIVKVTMEECNISSPKEMGLLMKNIMPKIKGRADGKMVSKIAQNLLTKPGD
ncbi:GatB/YqeY domain-containing protein [Anaerosphaera multitolerans]|uniref:GatB/YqeY domain-containing protein n=1 Tax=Anaerosphaera multitolerans TaxID=2487351 RepID=A0A437S8B3_9FIRM|nr:GatB/YqeY domain-containing protein [Anaerosphaera multitolerans]RVU55330.1 GatB/YqeY domain-containing protein [Anaerosphaera multitolerans]